MQSTTSSTSSRRIPGPLTSRRPRTRRDACSSCRTSSTAPCRCCRLSSAPTRSSAFVSSAWFWVGESLYGLGQLDDALAAYQKIVTDFPTSVKLEAAQYKVSLIQLSRREVELSKLLKWSHEDFLKSVEEYQNREKAYVQAIEAYQKRLAGVNPDEDRRIIADLQQQLAKKTDEAAQLAAELNARASAPAAPAERPAAATDARREAGCPCAEGNVPGVVVRQRGNGEMRMRDPAFPVVLALLFAALPLFALDVADGRARLSLVEGIGRFVLSCQTAGSTGAYVPLLAAQDPRTTFLSIVVGNKVYRMGESSEFSEKAEKVPGGARFTWKSSFIQVTETFTFIPAVDSSVEHRVCGSTLSLKNLSEQEITAGARYLFDTYLGESRGLHFRTSTLAQVSKELTVTPADKATWWESPLGGDPDGFGFQVMLAGPGLTTPDRVVFANWKRLSDANWDFDTSAARGFSLLPYSVNDSAAAQYYDPRPIPRSGETTFTLAMGLFSKAGYAAAPAAAAAAPTTPPPAATPAPPPDFSTGVRQSLDQGKSASSDAQAVRADLSAVNAILNELDARMPAAGSVTDDELALIESALKDLAGRAGRYAPAAGK